VFDRGTVQVKNFRYAAFAAAALLAAGSIGLDALAQNRPSGDSKLDSAVKHPTRNAPLDLDQIRPDPSVRRGVLPNGLRYAVVSNRIPAKGLSIRLHFDVGSYDERDDERGVAHFLEHMAFNGTRHIPEGRIDTVFGAAGVAFGRDQNASTGLFATRYELDIPQADAAKMDLAFQWLRDVGDGIDLKPEAVARERGVVKAEDDRSRGPERNWWERVEKFMSPELRSSVRSPIGEPASIASMEPARLRAFWERWYRPDNALIVVVGDFPADVLEQRVHDAFGSWKPAAPGPKPARQPYSKPDLKRAHDVLTVAEPALPTNASLCFVRPDDTEGADTVERERLRLTRRLWRDVLNERLRGAASSDDPPFVMAQVSMRENDREAAYACLDVIPVRDDWKRAVDSALTEVRRLQAHGVSQSELDRARDGVRAEYRAAAEGQGSRSSTQIAERLVATEANGDIVASPVERFRVLDRVALPLTTKDVETAFKRDFTGAGPLMVVTTPGAVQAAEVKTVWREAMARPAPAPVDQTQTTAWAYSNFGPPGKVASREIVERPGFVRLRWENGVVVNFKYLDRVEDRVKVRVRFGAGRREIAKADYYAGQFGAGLFVEGGLGKHDAESVRRLFNDHGWSAELDIGNDFFVLEGATNPTDMNVQLQILAAYMSDAGFRRSLDAKLPTSVELMERSTRASADYAVSQALNKAVAPDGVYVLPPKEELLKLDSKAFERVLKPALTQAPIEITIVGDASEEAVIDAVSRTFGALPPRQKTDRRRADTWFLRYPAKLPEVVRTTYEGVSDKSVVQLVWPLYVAEPKRRREEYALMILAQVMDDAIRHKVREDLGAAYAPQVGMTSPDAADQGSIQAYIETTARDADAVAQAAKETAAELAVKGVTEEAFEAARKPVLDSGATRLDSIDWWLGGLDGSAGNYEILREFLDWDADMGSVTLADVNRVAKVWLAQRPIVVIATPKAAGSTSASASAAAAPKSR
jgi:zinc protease